MRTIYSEIIWNQLGLKDYQIHKEEGDKTNKLILDWVNDSSLEKVQEVLFGLSWINKVVDNGWYDGQFYGFNQRTVPLPPNEDGTPQSDLMIHDCGMLPTIFHMALKTGVGTDELRLIADLIDAYDKKLPKADACSNRELEYGDEI